MDQRKVIGVRIDFDPLIDDAIGGPTIPPDAGFAFGAIAYLVSGTGPKEKKSMPSRMFWFPDAVMPSEKYY